MRPRDERGRFVTKKNPAGHAAQPKAKPEPKAERAAAPVKGKPAPKGKATPRAAKPGTVRQGKPAPKAARPEVSKA